MELELPPPDPNESLHLTPEGELTLDEPTVVFASGPPSDEIDRLSDAVVAFRPGLLIVVAR
jgi:hypothetical protein